MDRYYDSEEFRRTLQQYEDLRDKGASCFLDAEELADVAEYYHMNRRYEDATEAIDYALRIFPGSSTALALKARMALLDENNPRKAEELAEKITDKEDAEYVFLQGEIMMAEHHIDEADQYLSSHLETFGGDEEDFIIDVANLFADYQQMELAEKWLKRSTLTDDNDYKDISARILMSRGKYDESEKMFNELIDRDPYSSTYWNRLASSQFMRNNIRDSITSSEYSIAINPNDDEAILNKANGLFSLGNYDEALKFYQQYCRLQPNNEAGELFVGISLINLNKTEEALLHLKKALVLAEKACENGATYEDANMVQILQEIAFLESHMHHRDAAMAYLDRIDEVGGDHNLIDVARGYVCLESNDGKGSEHYFRKAIEESNSSAEVLLQIGIAAYDNGLIKTAYNMLTNMFAVAPADWQDGYAYYARCCYMLGDMEFYHLALQVAIQRNPSEARMILGDLYPEDSEPEDYPGLNIDNTN